MADPAMKAFGTLLGEITYLALKAGVDPEPVLEKLNEAIEAWVDLTRGK